VTEAEPKPKRKRKAAPAKPVTGMEGRIVERLDSLERRVSNLSSVAFQNNKGIADLVRAMDRMIVELTDARTILAKLTRDLEASRADFVVIQNNDTEIFGDVYTRMRRILKHEPSFGALGPVTSECGSWQAIDRIVSVWAKTSPRGKIHMPSATARSRDVERLREVQRCTDHAGRDLLASSRFADHVEPIRGMLAFFCVMLTRRAVDEVGLLDTDYGLGFGDDDDYCDRLHEAAFDVGLAPGCYVRHDHRTTFREHFSALEIARLQRQAMALLKRKRAQRARAGRVRR